MSDSLLQLDLNTENVTEFVDAMLGEALRLKASDVHIEPMRHQCLVRFRLDGLLTDHASFPSEVHQTVSARLKIMANIRLDEQRRPQDGRIELSFAEGVSLRVSTMPTLYGEKIALRIIHESSNDFSLASLGLSEAHQKIILRNVEKPFGLIVVCGPTGSGKTTTLYSLLAQYTKRSLNISTLEDPIERSVPGVNQTQINPSVELNFPSGLRALLRQDPDVLMVGEIRDSETMHMATNAALTGHAVLTTLHTNDAPSAFTRFLEMKVEEFVISSTVNLVIAQRLVRRVCGDCAKPQILDDHIVSKIVQRQDILKIMKDKGLSIDKLKNAEFMVGVGCTNCRMTGFNGRVGVYELMEMNGTIREALFGRHSTESLRSIAEQFGFRALVYDALEKVLAGTTTFSELLRITHYDD